MWLWAATRTRCCPTIRTQGRRPLPHDGSTIPLGYKVPVVQAASYSKVLGELKVTFSDIGIVKEAVGDPIALDKSITPDPAVLERIAELGGADRGTEEEGSR